MPRIPKLLTHSQGFFFVRTTGEDGKRHDHNFGRDRVKAEFQYNQFVAELCQKRNNPQPVRSIVNLSIDELVVRYLDTIRERYEPTNSFTDYKKAGELLSRLYGRYSVTTFIIPHFQNLIKVMLDEGKAKRTINLRIGAVKRIFQYALDCELITAEQYFKIKSVGRIRKDDIRVKPERIVPPVDVDVVRRTFFLDPLFPHDCRHGEGQLFTSRW